MTIKTLRTWITLVLLSAVLAGCGGVNGDDGTTTHIRLLNAAPDLGAANLYTDTDQRASNVAPDTVSGYAEFDPGSYTVKVTSSIGITLASVSQDLDKNSRYTAVVWGRSGAANLTVLTEADSDTNDMNSGWGRLRVFNSAGNESGNLDIYLLPNSTGPTPDLSTSTAAIAGTTTTVTAYSDLLAGTYRLVVTGAGDPTDVRLDLPSFTLGNQQLLTLVLEPSASGVLVHALILAHQADLAVAKNQSARVRLVASVTAKGQVTATANGTALSGTALISPQIGGYTLVPAGKASIALIVGGVGSPVDSSVTSFVAGADYTLLVGGPASAPIEKTLFDDNRLPATSTKAKIRLIDGFVSGGSASLTVTSTAAGTVTTPPDASAYVQITPNSSANLTVTSPTAGTLFTTLSSGGTSNTSIVANGVYSVFILDGGSTSTTPAQPLALGQLFQER